MLLPEDNRGRETDFNLNRYPFGGRHLQCWQPIGYYFCIVEPLFIEGAQNVRRKLVFYTEFSFEKAQLYAIIHKREADKYEAV